MQHFTAMSGVGIAVRSRNGNKWGACGPTALPSRRSRLETAGDGGEATVGYWVVEPGLAAVDDDGGTAHAFQMIEAPTFLWRGWGRWLSFAAAAYITIMGIGGVLIALQRDSSAQLQASAGWDLFLGLLLGGVVASNNKRAPLAAAVIAALMAVRVIGGLMIGRPLAVVSIDLMPMLMAGIAAFDLRRQARDL